MVVFGKKKAGRCPKKSSPSPPGSWGIPVYPGFFLKSWSRDSRKCNPGIFRDFQKHFNDCILRLSTPFINHNNLFCLMMRDGWDLCLSNLFYRQKSPQMYEIGQIYELKRKSCEIPHFLVKFRDTNFRLIPSQKILGSRDFAKSRPENRGIENSWSRWSLLPTVRALSASARGRDNT